MHILHRSQRPRSVPAFTPLPFSSTTITSVSSTSSTTTTHAHRPAGGNIGGNISGSPGANLGPPAPTGIPSIDGGETTQSPPAFAPPPTTASPNAPASSSTPIVISIPSSQAPSSASNGANSNSNTGNSNNGQGGGSSVSVQFGPGPIASGSSFGIPTLGTSPQPVATNGGSGTQVPGGSLSGPAITQGSITPTLPAGQISTSTVPPSNSPSQTDAVSVTSKGSRGGVTAGGVAGTLGVLALISLAIFLFVLRRRRVMRATHEETPTIREVMTPPLPLQQESDVMPTSPIPQYKHQSYVPTAEPSTPPQMHPDTPKRGPSPPPMTEINARPQTDPTLILNNARYRRNNNRLSIRIEEPKVDAHRRSGAYGLTPFADPSPVSPQSSDTSAYRAASTVRGSGASPASSQTSLYVPPSPRTPTRRTVVIPPIPPLPKSPPPVPGVSINPFVVVDRNPFDDPPGRLGNDR